MDPLTPALLGLSRADRQMNAAAQKLASPNADPTEALVEMSMARVQQEASLAVTQTVSDTLGTLVNTYA